MKLTVRSWTAVWRIVWVGVLVVVFLIVAIENNLDMARRGRDGAKVETLSCIEAGQMGHFAVIDIAFHDGLWTAALVGPDGKRTGAVMRTNAVCVTARP